jgi:hypothetical protein
MDVAPLTDLLREAEEHHGEYEATAPKHHWPGWFAAYIDAHEQACIPEEASNECRASYGKCPPMSSDYDVIVRGGANNILGEPREANYEAVPRVVFSDGERLTGAYALDLEAGEWLQRATLAIRARVPLEVRDTIRPFPTFSEIYVAAMKALRGEITAALQPIEQDRLT